MKKNLETIRHACIAANPQIMKLGFGCEIANNEALKRGIAQGQKGNFISYSNGMHWYLSNGEIYPIAKEFIEILGRKIGLADVLIAVSKNCKTSKKVSDSPEWMVVTHWDLFKDDLNNQSREFVAVLAGLLSAK